MSGPGIPNYLDYKWRRRGLDHDRFQHRNLPQARPVAWPGKARVALWVAVHVGHFPMDMPRTPFVAPGGVDRPYPSYWDYTQRDYGNRIGIYRLMRALDARGVRATALLNSAVATRYPALVKEIAASQWEVAAAGVDMGKLHHGGLAEAAERALVEEAVGTLRGAFPTKVRGWHSPAHSESSRTLDLVAAAGLDYVADWINDDMPYPFTTARGPLVHLPLSYDLSDRKIFHLHNQTMAEYEHQIGAAFDVMLAEARARGGRILSLSLSPWVIGMPSRIATLDRLLKRFAAEADVGSATGHEIMTAWRAGQAGS